MTIEVIAQGGAEEVKDGKVEILDMKLARGTLRARFPSKDDRDAFIVLMEALFSPGVRFSLPSEVEVVWHHGKEEPKK